MRGVASRDGSALTERKYLAHQPRLEAHLRGSGVVAVRRRRVRPRSAARAGGDALSQGSWEASRVPRILQLGNMRDVCDERHADRHAPESKESVGAQ